MKILLYKNFRSYTRFKWNITTPSEEDAFIRLNDINFNYNDNVYTEITLNLPIETLTPNDNISYLVCTDDNLTSNWYVVGFKKIRGYQYLFKLKRDLLNDYFNILNKLRYDTERIPYTKYIETRKYLKSDNLFFQNLFNEENKEQFIQNYYKKYEDKITFEMPLTYKVNDLLIDKMKNERWKEKIKNISWNVNNEKGYYIIFFNSNYPYKPTDIGYKIINYEFKIKNLNINEYLQSYFQMVINGEDYEYSENNINYTLSSYPFVSNQNAFGVFALPREIIINNSTIYNNITIDTIDIINAMLKSNSDESIGGYIIDVQYMPYLPKNFATSINNFLVCENKDNTTDYRLFVPIIDINNYNNDLMLFNYEAKDVIVNNELALTEDLKTNALFDEIKLSSPTQQYSFNFKPLKALTIGGVFSNHITLSMNVSLTPNSSFIAISFFDQCLYNYRRLQQLDNTFYLDTSDYSIDYNSSAFSQYVAQNRNYRAIYNRQEANNDVQYWLGFGKQLASSTAQMTIGGAEIMAGGTTANPKMMAQGMSDLSQGATFGVTAPFDIASYYVNRKANRDVFNMQIENIKNAPSNPLIKNNFTNLYKGAITLNHFTITDTNKDDYKRYLRDNGLPFLANDLTLKEIKTKGLIYDYTTYGKFKAIISIDDNENLNNLSNYMLNEINKELQNGVFFTEEFLRGIE